MCHNSIPKKQHCSGIFKNVQNRNKNHEVDTTIINLKICFNMMKFPICICFILGQNMTWNMTTVNISEKSRSIESYCSVSFVSLHVKVFPSWPQHAEACWRHWGSVKDIPGIHAEIPSCMNPCAICSLNCRKECFSLIWAAVCDPTWQHERYFTRLSVSVDVHQLQVLQCDVN